MNKLTKKISLLLVVAMVFAMAMTGCTQAPTQPEVTTPADTTPAEQPEPTNQPEEKPADEEFRLVDDDGNEIDADRSAVGENGIVSSARYEASKIGVEIIEKGGNAVDAAVATAFAVGVCEPFSNGIGGGGFMTLHIAETGEDVFIDFREVAPQGAVPEIFVCDEDGNPLDKDIHYGGASVAVPGEVAGLLYILDKYGTMSREDVIRPAVELANNGFVINPLTKWALDYGFGAMSEYKEFGKIYLKDDLPYELGDTIKNPDLGKALELIIKDGEDAFYRGPIADAIVASTTARGGIMTKEDLANYKVNSLEPVRGTYRGYDVISSPPPSSGGAHLIQILNILENFDVASMKPYSAEHIHLLSEVMKLSYADRAEYMGDPNYVDVPLEGLMSKDYAKKLAAKIDMTKSQEYEADDPFKFEGNDTQHLSVADKEGNMVAMTKSLNDYWGSTVLVEGYGFLLNNHMDDFNPEPGKPNSVAPGKKPLSSMSPTLVMKDGKPFMVLGCPGGSTIFPQVAQVISDVVDFGMGMQEAIDQPRVIDDLENMIYYPSTIDESVIEELKGMGHAVETIGDDEFGYIQAALYGEDGKIYGGADSYSDGKAVGY